MGKKPRPPAPAPEPAPAPSPAGKRWWTAPTMINPLTVNVGGVGTGPDYIVDARGNDIWVRYTSFIPRRLIIRNHHNLRIVAGEHKVDSEWSKPEDRWGLYSQGGTGVIDVEGVLAHGTKIIEGIDIGQWYGAPNQYPTAVQIQSCRIEGIRDPDGAFHADCIQAWGGVGELRIYNCTLESQFQCFMAKANENRLGLVDMRRVNMRGLDIQQACVLNHQHGYNADGNPFCERIAYGGDGSPEQRVLIRRPAASKPGADFGHANFGRVATPNADNTTIQRAVLGTAPDGRQFLEWPTALSPRVTGRVWEHAGEPDYVPVGTAGMGYAA